jgi:hypothetical protein
LIFGMKSQFYWVLAGWQSSISFKTTWVWRLPVPPSEPHQIGVL